MIIPIKPQSKGRHQFNTRTRTAYTPEKTREYERELGKWYKVLGGKKHIGTIAVVVRFVYATKDKRKRGEYKTSKPDLDNLVKALDGLNGIAWDDDAWIVNIAAVKIWGDRDYVELHIMEL